MDDLERVITALCAGERIVIVVFDDMRSGPNVSGATLDRCILLVDAAMVVVNLGRELLEHAHCEAPAEELGIVRGRVETTAATVLELGRWLERLKRDRSLRAVN